MHIYPHDIVRYTRQRLMSPVGTLVLCATLDRLSIWAWWISVYGENAGEVLGDTVTQDDSPKSRNLKQAVASQLFALSLYEKQTHGDAGFIAEASEAVFGPDTLHAENEAVEK